MTYRSFMAVIVWLEKAAFPLTINKVDSYFHRLTARAHYFILELED